MNSIAVFSKKISLWKRPCITTVQRVLSAQACRIVTAPAAAKTLFCEDFGKNSLRIDKKYKIGYTL